MKKHFLFLALICSLTCFAQYETTIEAKLLDKKTNQPIPYANIGFFEKSIGTVSDANGDFKLLYLDDAIGNTDELQVSALGYQTLKVSKKQFERYLVNTNKIYLRPEPLALDAVVITNDKKVQVRLGSNDNSSDLMGYWKDKKALGGELATKIKIRKDNTQLLDFKFNVLENASDSIKVRVNIYEYKRGKPHKKISSQNIFHTISKKSGLEVIDLKPYNIFVSDDVVISLELLEVFGSDISLAISARKDYKGNSFTRYISKDKWNKMKFISLNFSVLSSEILNVDGLDVNRFSPEKITLYWDVSYSMYSRDLNKELDFLKSYLKQFKSLKIDLITFSNTEVFEQEFQIRNGNADKLINHLESINYNGATSFKNVLKTNKNNADIALVFTDGKTIFEPLETEISIPVFTVNSKKDANHVALQRAAFNEGGYYINLNEVSKKEALNFILKDLEDTKDYDSYKPDSVISGNVSSEELKLQGVSVRVKSTLKETKTDIDGNFTISASIDDILEFTFLAMEKKEVIVNNANPIEVEMIPDAEILNEIVIEAEKKKQEEVESAFGNSKKDALGYGVNVMEEKDIRPSMIFLSDVIRRGNFPGVTVNGYGLDAKYSIRGTISINFPADPIFVVDGIIYTDPPNFIDPQNIKKITLIKSLAGTVRYGTLGRGGVFIIKTKSGSPDFVEKPINKLLVKGNDYEEKLPLLESSVKKSEVTLALEQASGYQDALNIYNRLILEGDLKSIPFYFDASDYFMRWDKDKAIDILTTIAEVAPKNVKALKALAYKLEALEELEKTKYLYEEIMTLRPKDAQSYRDLALIYSKVKMYDEAMAIYKNILNKSIEGIDFTGLGDVIENELKAFVLNNRVHINYKDLPNEFLTANFKKDLRIVFEWNDPNVEFDIQFVSPQKKYYKWQHSIFNNKDRLFDEIKNGYHTEEFIIDDAASGEWIINIECLSEEELLNPTFLKYTVFTNYGLPNEKKDVRVIKLYDQKQKVTLDKLFYK